MIFTPLSLSLAAVMIVLAIGYAMWAEAQDTFAPDVPTSFYPAYEEKLQTLDRRALEQAYRAQVQLLFTNWMRDPTGQPSRAKHGINRAKEAFVGAHDEIVRREETFKQMITRPSEERK